MTDLTVPAGPAITISIPSKLTFNFIILIPIVIRDETIVKIYYKHSNILIS